MKITGLALLLLVLAAISLELFALHNPTDNIFTITFFFRHLPCFATTIIWSIVSLLIGHFYL